MTYSIKTKVITTNYYQFGEIDLVLFSSWFNFASMFLGGFFFNLSVLSLI